MSDDRVIIDSLAFSGYRSFGEETQRFEYFSKVNLFIGQNNCGKSNVLKFIHDIYPKLYDPKKMNVELSSLEKHKPNDTEFSYGVSRKKETEPYKEQVELEIMAIKANLDKTEKVWFDFGSTLKLLESQNWEKAAKEFIVNFNGRSSRRYSEHQFQDLLSHTLKNNTPSISSVKQIVMIPAIRKVGVKDSTSDDFSGEGIIERLAILQNPDVGNDDERIKFDQINTFLRNVTDNNSAEIEIPNKRDTILVHMDGKRLPLESLGTGIHEVIILASAATILEDTVICMEEPELHLNPILQKKLVRYLDEATSNQYFITTHSAALMDTPNTEIYHIHLEDGASKVSRVTSDSEKSEVCAGLGYHPSDLLQSNCVIWVEGPSDRIYLNYWIRKADTTLVEGIHYSIMFYGGRLASHLSGNDTDEAIDDFISLRRMNRHAVIVIDSDRGKARARINATKIRLKKEFDDGSGFAWITQGREIENYLPVDQVKDAIASVHPTATPKSKFTKYDNCLLITTKKRKKTQASKVKVAKYIVENNKGADTTMLDLKVQIKKLVNFIEDANPKILIEKNN